MAVESMYHFRWYKPNEQSSEIQADDLFREHGIISHTIWEPSLLCVEETRRAAISLLKMKMEDGEYPHLQELIREWNISIISQKTINFWLYVEILDEKWRIFLCKKEDIIDNSINPLDIFVVKWSRISRLYPELWEYIKSWEIVIYSKDCDDKISVIWKYASATSCYQDIIQVERQKWTSEYLTQPSFNICRVRDIFVGTPLDYYW